MNLNDVHRGIVKHKKAKRIGRGVGSGHGKTAGKGHKGRSSRAGYSAKIGFEGGQTVLIRRIPKRGFHNPWGIDYFTINVSDLGELFEAGATVNLETLHERRNFSKALKRLKILGDGELQKKLKVEAHKFTESAKAKIAAAGGEAIELPGPAPVKRPERKKAKAKS